MNSRLPTPLRCVLTRDFFLFVHRFEADGGGEVGPNGLIKLLVTFKPTPPSQSQPGSRELGSSTAQPAARSGKDEVVMEGTLRVVVWEGQGLDQEEREQAGEGRHELSAQDGTLRCTTKTGEARQFSPALLCHRDLEACTISHYGHLTHLLMTPHIQAGACTRSSCKAQPSCLRLPAPGRRTAA